MDDENKTTAENKEGTVRGFLASFFVGLARDAFRLIIAFAVGTGGGALVCWYYGIPLAFSLLGGILVLGLAVAFMSDSIFS